MALSGRPWRPPPLDVNPSSMVSRDWNRSLKDSDNAADIMKSPSMKPSIVVSSSSVTDEVEAEVLHVSLLLSAAAGVVDEAEDANKISSLFLLMFGGVEVRELIDVQLVAMKCWGGRSSLLR